MQTALLRLFREEAEFVIGDPTEIRRPTARKTDYVGTLSDGKTLGFWLLVLSAPFRGRAIPFHFIIYSSRTINQQVIARNQEHFRAFARVKAFLPQRPLVLDREFSYQGLLEALMAEKIHFVIRLNFGSQQPTLIDEDGKAIKLRIVPGKKVVYRNLWYLGKVRVNIIGVWRKGFRSPLWVMTDLKPEESLRIYRQRMKIDEIIRDFKNLLALEKVMNKRQDNMEKIVGLLLLADVIGMFLGEGLRAVTYGAVKPEEIYWKLLRENLAESVQKHKWQLYSGLFVLLKQKPRLLAKEIRKFVRAVLAVFVCLGYGIVRSLV